MPTDVATGRQVDALAVAAITAHGRVDVWANVAGIMRNSLIVDVTPEDVEAVTRVNLGGIYWGIAAAVGR